MKMKSALILSSISSSSSQYQEFDLSSNSVKWMIESCDGKIQIPATVPGLVHTDLLTAGVLNENPYYRFNELDQSWVAKESCWKYTTSFSFDKEQSFFHTNGEESIPIFLRLSGIDTIATVTLNDQLIGSTSNAVLRRNKRNTYGQ